MKKCKIITCNLTTDTLEKLTNDFLSANPKINIDYLVKETNSITIIYDEKK